MPIARYAKACIVVPDKTMLDRLETIQPGEKVLYGYEYHPVFCPDVLPSLSEQAHALVDALEAAQRIMRFVVRESTGRFAYVALGVTPAVYQQVEAMAASVELPPILVQIRAKYAVGKKS